MQVLREETFVPVTLILESQAEVDAIGSLLNHTGILDAVEEIFGTDLRGTNITNYRSTSAKDKWAEWHSALRNAFRRYL